LKTFIALFFAISYLAFAQEYTIKFATVAPDGSTWMNVMREFDQAIRKESNGKMGFKIYAGGVQGDERDVLRKIKLGQLHSAGVTGVGMTSIASKARILDSPFLFKSYDEVDTITAAFDQELKQAFVDGGYVNLGWAEVGWTYVFTNTPVRSPEDMKKVKMWMWEGDPIAEAAFKAIGINPIPLSLTDVLTSLQTKLIDGVYAPPLAVIALQWFSRVKYMLDAPLADAVGAIIISKKKFDELPPDLQEILRRNGTKYMKKLTALSREDNAKSIETLKKNGVTMTELSLPEARASYDEIGKKARLLLVGKLFPEDLLNRLEKAVADYRNTHQQKNSK
jgi:TRAP-type C4-dicarboxylate transport system substrate-binding protein